MARNWHLRPKYQPGLVEQSIFYHAGIDWDLVGLIQRIRIFIPTLQSKEATELDVLLRRQGSVCLFEFTLFDWYDTRPAKSVSDHRNQCVCLAALAFTVLLTRGSTSEAGSELFVCLTALQKSLEQTPDTCWMESATKYSVFLWIVTIGAIGAVSLPLTQRSLTVRDQRINYFLRKLREFTFPDEVAVPLILYQLRKCLWTDSSEFDAFVRQVYLMACGDGVVQGSGNDTGSTLQNQPPENWVGYVTKLKFFPLLSRRSWIANYLRV